MDDPTDTGPDETASRRTDRSETAPDETRGDGSHRSPTRRRVLGALGVGAAGVVGATAVPGVVGAQTGPPDGPGRRGRRGDGGGGGGPRNGPAGGGRRGGGRGGATPDTTRFTRLFDGPSFARADGDVRAALMAIGAPGGMLDADDPLEEGPERLVTEESLSANNPDNPSHTAGITFVGQFLDHDITADAGSRLGRPVPLRRSRNLRTAAFDLDSVYGGGPDDSPALYEPGDPGRLRVESGGLFEDVPRDDDGIAIIGDDRNDENLIISGLQAAMLSFHNAVLDDVVAGGSDDLAAFEEARRLVRWHWQWLIVHEFLPAFVGQSMVDDVLGEGRRFYTPTTPRIPVEFQTSAYRFGHSMVRPSYRANLAGDQGDPFFGLVFDPDQFGRDDPDDLAGGSRAPRRFVGWQTFFDFDDGEVKHNKKIDTAISTPLFQLPAAAIASPRGDDLGPTALAQRNLLRHITWEVASGQRIAGEMGVAPLTRGDLSQIDSVSTALATSTPLWLYVLREAELAADGEHLGPVGGRIVAEVFVGLLELDPQSYLSAQPDWRPTLPVRDETEGFRMIDLLTKAGVDPDSRGQ